MTEPSGSWDQPHPPAASMKRRYWSMSQITGPRLVFQHQRGADDDAIGAGQGHALVPGGDTAPEQHRRLDARGPDAIKTVRKGCSGENQAICSMLAFGLGVYLSCLPARAACLGQGSCQANPRVCPIWPGVCERRLAGVGQVRLPCAAVEQLQTRFALRQGDVAADGRLGARPTGRSFSACLTDQPLLSMCSTWPRKRPCSAARLL